MRCKKHLSDFSSSVGVCASCLRDRLFRLIDQQSNSPQFTHPRNPNPNPNPNPNSKQQPPPLIFPRSVSPYISRRKSEPIPRFYATPQVCPKKKQNSGGKFNLIAKLFRSRSSNSSSTTTTTSSYNSAVLARRSNRGMSPENEVEEGCEPEESPARWRNRPSPARVRPSPARAASMAFCLSPLVRASPARHWGGGSSEVGFSGEIRVPVVGKVKGSNCEKPHLSAAASFCANRSRKIADFGRLDRKR